MSLKPPQQVTPPKHVELPLRDQKGGETPHVISVDYDPERLELVEAAVINRENERYRRISDPEILTALAQKFLADQVGKDAANEAAQTLQFMNDRMGAAMRLLPRDNPAVSPYYTAMDKALGRVQDMANISEARLHEAEFRVRRMLENEQPQHGLTNDSRTGGSRSV